MARGDCQVQDEAAGAVVAFMDPQPGELILDACAAPGGKAMFIAQRMRGEVTFCAIFCHTKGDDGRAGSNCLCTHAGKVGCNGRVRGEIEASPGRCRQASP